MNKILKHFYLLIDLNNIADTRDVLTSSASLLSPPTSRDSHYTLCLDVEPLINLERFKSEACDRTCANQKKSTSTN